MASGKYTGNRKSARQGRSSGRTYWFLGVLAAITILGGVLYSNATQSAEAKPVEQFMHLHGLSTAPWAPDDVFVSTHQGLIRIDAKGNWRFVSKVPHDFMGFQVNPTEENVLYSSGHPAPGSNLQNPLGFMISRDAGATWNVVALAGQVDFHAMAVQPTDGNVIYGWSGGLHRSLDGGQTWERLPAGSLEQSGGAYALAVHPDDANTVLAGTGRGLLRSTDGGRSWEQFDIHVPVTAVTYDPSSTRVYAYGADPGTGLLISDDAGDTWQQAGMILENNDAVGYIALHPAEPDTYYLGSFGQNLYKTTDAGTTWELLAERGVPTNR
jgi:hypothetical protein